MSILSILIVNWNSKDYLRRCLETVHSTCADITHQIVVVDGGSFDGCFKMLKDEFREVQFVQSQDNIGFGRANNLGFDWVKGDTLLLLNPDTELAEEGVSLLLEQLNQLPRAGILGPRLLNSDGTLQTSCVQALPTPLNQVFDSEFLRKLFPRSNLWGVWEAFSAKEPVEVEAVSGACMLMYAETFRRVERFSPQYFMYGEDMDICAKVRAIGLKVYHVPSVEVTHHGGGSSSTQISQFSELLSRESLQIFIREHQGYLSGFLFRLTMILSSVFRMALLFPIICVGGTERKQSIHQSWEKWLTILKWSTGIEKAYRYIPEKRSQ